MVLFLYLCGMYTEDQRKKIVSDICNLVASGMALRNAVKEIGIKADTFYAWIDSNDKFLEQYTRAKSEQIEAKFDSIERDYLESPKLTPEGKIDPAWVNLQRLKIDAKKWELSKLAPKKYGDKLEVDQKTHLSGSVETKTLISFTKGQKAKKK